MRKTITKRDTFPCPKQPASHGAQCITSLRMAACLNTCLPEPTGTGRRLCMTADEFIMQQAKEYFAERGWNAEKMEPDLILCMVGLCSQPCPICYEHEPQN